jgi:hypothetical protein
MKLVKHSDDRKHEGNHQEELLPGRFGFEIKGGSQQSTTSKKVSEVKNLIEVRDVKELESTRWMKFVPVGKETQEDEPQNEGRPPEGGVVFE